MEKAYLIILDTQLLIYFIPYVYLFISFLLHRRTEAPPDTVRVPGGAVGAWLVGHERTARDAVRDGRRDGPAGGRNEATAVRAEGGGWRTGVRRAWRRRLLAANSVGGDQETRLLTAEHRRTISRAFVAP